MDASNLYNIYIFDFNSHHLCIWIEVYLFPQLASEVSSKMNGIKPSDKIEATGTFTKLDSEAAAALPEFVDWRTEGIVTPIKDQTGCGCCWAFSTVSMMTCIMWPCYN